MLAVDLPLSLGRGLLDHQPTGRRFRWRAEAGQPTVAQAANSPQRTRRCSAEPDLERLLKRLRSDRETVIAEARPFVINLVLTPEPSQQGQHLVEPGCPLAALNAERLLLGLIDHA